MSDDYIDPWGDQATKNDLTNWTKFEPWQFWQNGYNWIKCDEEIEEQDIIAFRDDVAEEYPDGSKRYFKGNRFILGRIAGIDEDKFYIEVIHSEGEKAYLPEDKIYRAKRWLIRYGVYRFPRDANPTEGRTPEQIKQFEKDKEKRLKEDKPISNTDHRTRQGEKKADFLALHQKFASDFLKAAKKHTKHIDKFKLDR